MIVLLLVGLAFAMAAATVVLAALFAAIDALSEQEQRNLENFSAPGGATFPERAKRKKLWKK